MNNLDNLEKKLNIANNLLEEFNDISLELEELPEATEIVPVTDNSEVSVLSMDSLKQDFLLVRNNIFKLINTGQRILDAVSVLDVSDIKASQLQAIAQLQTALGQNIRSLVGTYKEIAEIEKLRVRETKVETAPNINTGTVTTNNIVFSGDSSQLLDLIKQNTK